MLKFAGFDIYLYFVYAVSQQWRLWFLAVGFILLLLAPSISSWVHFYYSTSMVIGVFMVIIFLLFQVLFIFIFKSSLFQMVLVLGLVLFLFLLFLVLNFSLPYES